MEISLLLEMAADGFGDRVAVGARDGGFTYAQLHEQARRVARWLHAQPIEHVAVLDESSPALPVALFGAAFAGRPFVPLSYRLADEQLRAVAARIAPALVVAGAGMEHRLTGLDGVEVVPRAALLDVATATATTTTTTTTTATASPLDASLADSEGIAVLLFTSGTTGPPKAAVLRHRHLTAYVFSTLEFMGAGEDECALVSVPPYHVAGVASVLSSVYVGRRLVFLPAFEPEAWVRLVAAEAVTHAMVVPTMLERLVPVLERAGPAPLASLRHLAYGGGRMPVPLLERALALLPGVDFVNAYGLTETSSTIAVLTPDDHREAFASTDPEVRARLGSVGRPTPAVEVTIRDADGRPVPVGERGEVWVRGEQVAGEYLDAGQARHAVRDGWFPTRDAGRLDAAGYLYLEGRLDDVIVRGGENLSPGEIEEVLVAHPAVAEAAVVGVPDPQWGEAVAAAVVLEPGAQASPEELQAWVRARLRSARTPEHIELRAELPYNETGKLLRRVLREELARARSGLDR